MATQVPPKKGTAYTTYLSLISQADTCLFKTSVTLAAGDVQVSKDGGSFANITTLPTEIGSTGVLSVALSATEMNADTVVVRFRDAAGAEWCDALLVLHTQSQTVGDLASSTALQTVDDNVDAILADTGTDGVVLADGAITAAKIGTGAIGSDEIAAAAANKIADHTIRRSFENACDSSDGDTKSFRSLLGAIAKLVNKLTVDDVLTVHEDDDTTVLGTQNVTSNTLADPITELDTV
jgi:hypothetical protein